MVLRVTATTFLLLISSVQALTAEEESQQLFSSYVTVLQNESEMVQAEYESENYRLNRLQQLRNRGHASWLETRKQKLKVDQLAAKAEAFGAYASIVKGAVSSFDMRTSIESVLRYPPILEFTDMAIKLDGFKQEPLVDRLIAQADRLKKDLTEKKEAFEKLRRQTQSLSDSDSWKKSYELKQRIASAEFAGCKSRLILVEQLISLLESSEQWDSDEIRSALPRQFDENFKRSVEKQVETHGRLIRHRLEIERQKFESLTKLQSRGIESTRDLKAVSDQMNRLQSSLEKQRLVISHLNHLSSHCVVDDRSQAGEDGIATSGQAVSSLDQMRKRFLQFEAEYHYQIAALEKEMLGEVLSRLEKAAKSTDASGASNSEVNDSLRIVRQNEINGYRQRIQFESLKMELALARIEALSCKHTMSEGVIHLSHHKSPALESVPSVMSAAFHGSLVANLLVPPSERVPGNSLAISDAIHSNVWGCFPTAFRVADSNYLPVKLTDYGHTVRRRYNRPTTRRSELPTRFNVGVSSLAMQSRRSYTPSYSPNRRPLKTFDRAYYNGIIRSELRPFLNPGQPPWYLPGSPTNLRVQQLRTDYQRDTFGRTGNELLRSKIYTDLYGR